MSKQRKTSASAPEAPAPAVKGKATAKENLTDLPEPAATAEEPGGPSSATPPTPTRPSATLGTQPLAPDLSTGGVLGGARPTPAPDDEAEDARD